MPPSALEKVSRNFAGASIRPPTEIETVLRFATPEQLQIPATGVSDWQPGVGADRDSYPGSPGVLGSVTHADGRVEAVLADGQWVRLVSASEPPAVFDNRSTSRHSGASPISGKGLLGQKVDGPSSEGIEINPADPAHPMLMAGSAARNPASGTLQNPESQFHNSVEPIGIVEWSSGRTQAVIAQGDSITLLEDREAIKETRSYLAWRPPRPEQSPEVSFLSTTDLSGRSREDEKAWFEISEGETSSRAPPADVLARTQEPEEIARGHPGSEVSEQWERPPPAPQGSGSGPWEEGLPGIESVPAASIEP